MSRHEQYSLEFGKKPNNQFICYISGSNQQYSRLAEKLRLMHESECTALVSDITAAQNNQFFETFFSIDRDSASDEDGIDIVPPNIIIDTYTTIPMQHMKEILQEWLAFRNS